MMAEKFSVPELTALRSELLQGFDSKDAAELIQMFLAGHGYGVSAEEARNAVARAGMLGNSFTLTSSSATHLTQIRTRVVTSQPMQVAGLQPRYNCDCGKLPPVCGSPCRHIPGKGMGRRRADDSGRSDPLQRPKLASALLRVYDLPLPLFSELRSRRSSQGLDRVAPRLDPENPCG